jgi:hypothetical protein
MSLTLGNDRSDAAASARVRQWARELWQLGDEDSVLVTQLRCSEPGCPPLETVIVIAAAGQPTVQHKLHKPTAEVSREDLQALRSEESRA